MNVCGDEYHYVLIFPFFKHSRTMYLKHYFYKTPSVYKFGKLYVRQVGKLYHTYRNLQYFLKQF